MFCCDIYLLLSFVNITVLFYYITCDQNLIVIPCPVHNCGVHTSRLFHINVSIAVSKRPRLCQQLHIRIRSHVIVKTNRIAIIKCTYNYCTDVFKCNIVINKA